MRRRLGGVPMTRGGATLVFAALAALAAPAPASAQAPGPRVAVAFDDASRPTRCAEEDNVYVPMRAPRIASFRVTAEHPRYVASVIEDSTAPDFSDCDMSGDPVFRFVPATVVLYEDATLRVVGHRFETFWRPGAVDFTVAGRGEPGLHLVQLIRRGPPRDVEMLVVYPSDGYWRAKPLPPRHLADTAYGSSFLVGPIETDGRPYVAIRAIELDVPTLTFRLAFADGSRGTLAIAASTRRRIELAVTLDPPVAPGRPFAALRSMYVRPDQADVSVAAWTTAGGARRSAPILGFGGVESHRARFGRDRPSHHNLSAPDMVFDRFATATK